MKLFAKKEENMVLRTRKGSSKLEWFNLQTEAVRRPEPRKQEYLTGLPFQAAGKCYRNLAELTVSQKEGSPWVKDIHGRQVLCLKERFPCFDSYDYLYEHRYNHWLYIREGNVLTQIHWGDERKTFTVTEDVDSLYGSHWEEMKKLGFCQK